MSRAGSRQDGPLRAVRALVRFDATKVGARVAAATKQCAAAQTEVAESLQRCEEAAGELRAIAGRSHCSPALLGYLQSIYRAERLGLEELNHHLAVAQRTEEQAREKLANLRNRERSVEKALLAQQHRRQLESQSRETALADDMWLQQAWKDL